MKEVNFKPRLDKVQDQFLDLINLPEIDVEQATLLMEDFVELANDITKQMELYIKHKTKLSDEFQESVIQIAHIRNMAEIVRKRLGLAK